MNLTNLIIPALLGAIALVCGHLAFLVKKKGFDKEETKVLPILSICFMLFGIGISFLISKYKTFDVFFDLSTNDFLPLYCIVIGLFILAAGIISAVYKRSGLTSTLCSLVLGVSIGIWMFYHSWIELVLVIALFMFGYLVTQFTQSIKEAI